MSILEEPENLASPTIELKSRPELHRRIIATGIIAIILVVFLFLGTEVRISAVFEKIIGFSAKIVGLALVLSLVQVFSQGLRLWALLPSADRPRWDQVLRIFTFGQLVNIFLPGRLGDIAKTVSLSKIRVNQTSIANNAGSVFVSDKLTDLSALMLLILIESPTLFKELPRFELSSSHLQIALAFIIAMVTALIMLRQFLRKWFDQCSRWLREILQGSSALADPRRFFLGLFFGITAWSVECITIGTLASGVGVQLSFTQALWVLVALNLGIAIPVSFANLGTFEAAMAFGLSRFGVPLTDALAVAGFHHLIEISSVVSWNLMLWFAAIFPSNESSMQTRQFRVQNPDKKRAFQYYEDRSINYNERVEKGPFASWVRNRERNAVLGLAGLGEDPKNKMIDVGCGGGFYAKEAKKKGLHVSAVDFSPGMIERLKGIVDCCWVDDIETLHADSTYDIVICSGVLDFVLHPEIAFSNLASLVNADGKLVIQVPRAGLLGWIYRMEKRFARIDVNLFSVTWFSEQARKHGLRVVACRHPLPHNMVVAFERLPSPCQPVSGRAEEGSTSDTLC